MAPVLHLAVAPAQPASIPTLFRSDEVRTIIEHPPVTRHEGFNILTYERAEIVEGDRIVIDAWRKRLELYKDATFVALGTFAELLGWPRDTAAFTRNPKINSLALIEFTYDFFKTYAAVLDHVEPLPVSLRCQLGIEGAHAYERRLWMAPYALNTYGNEMPHQRYEAPSDTVTRELDIEALVDRPHIQPGEIAYGLIEQVYNWFGLDSDMIPYASAANREIDPASF
ncbi:MAG TPA: hypothetical protein VFM96_14780 [Gaiellaceae bacterium]|nr:hypothetical protein [Gaiellaceae bacterium]